MAKLIEKVSFIELKEGQKVLDQKGNEYITEKSDKLQIKEAIVTSKQAIDNYKYLIEISYSLIGSSEGTGGAGVLYLDDVAQLDDITTSNTIVHSIQEAKGEDLEILQKIVKSFDSSLTEFDYYTISDTHPYVDLYLLGWFE